MNGHQLNMFASKVDLAMLMRAVELKKELQYVHAGLFDSPKINQRLTLLNDANFGIAFKGDSNLEERYLIADRLEIIDVRSVSQYGGGVKYAIDQKNNPRSIIFRPGGQFSETCIIAGIIGTISEDMYSLTLFNLFSKEIKKQFRRIQSFWVGKDAENLRHKGWRLTNSVKSSPLYDLK